MIYTRVSVCPTCSVTLSPTVDHSGKIPLSSTQRVLHNNWGEHMVCMDCSPSHVDNRKTLITTNDLLMVITVIQPTFVNVESHGSHELYAGTQKPDSAGQWPPFVSIKKKFNPLFSKPCMSALRDPWELCSVPGLNLLFFPRQTFCTLWPQNESCPLFFS